MLLDMSVCQLCMVDVTKSAKKMKETQKKQNIDLRAFSSHSKRSKTKRRHKGILVALGALKK